MKTCILFGNCQCSGINKFLEQSNFYEIYEIHQYQNWELIYNNEMSIQPHHLKAADLIIYQPLSDVYNCYSTNKKSPQSFFNMLKEECNIISFPRLHNNAIFPIFRKHAQKNIIYGNFSNNINSLDELIYLYNNNLIDYQFENRMNNNYIISKKKEEDTDVKIIDFIYKNITKQKLFLTHDHPTSFIFNEITNQICSQLELDYNYENNFMLQENIIGLEDSVYCRKDKQYPISRYAIDYFGFEYIKTEHSDANEFYKLNTIEKFNQK